MATRLRPAASWLWFRRLSCWTLWPALALLVACRQTELAPPLAVVPGSQLDRGARHTGLDAAIDDRGDLHVVWQVARWSNPSELWYAHRDASGAWPGDAQRLAEAADQPLRLVAGGERLFLLYGPRATLMVLDAGDRRWHRVGDLVDAELPASAFDAMVIEDELVVVYLEAGRHSAARGREFPFALREVRWRLGASQPGRSDHLANVPHALDQLSGDPLRPLLFRDRIGLNVLIAVNLAEHAPQVDGNGRTATRVRSHGRLYRWSRPDLDGSWTAAQALSTPQLPVLEGIALVESGQGIELVLAGTAGMPLHRLAAAGVDARPSPFLSPRSGSLDAMYVVGDLASHGPWLTWIDSRERLSERRPWRPLGGWPWSDQPDALNNDVFAVDLSDSDAQGEPQALRLSPPGGYAERLAIAVAADGSGQIVWSGRQRVGKRLDDHGAAPELFHAPLSRTPAVAGGSAIRSPRSPDSRSRQ